MAGRRGATPYCAASQLFSSVATAQRSEIEDDAQCRVNAAHLTEAEESDALAEPAPVDRRGLLGEHPGVRAAECRPPDESWRRVPT